ncbi:hypothetical protein GUITHDRAFT_107927 [Guillardia theta CCMP2712]|uniref:PDZ domain-containing protein n=1 Tax=Guillardia theta (strain CCMP2712) TaxID=905079 RepID=L1JDX6_GUITC|nr:hypothetical protein GUITHDRAFT_107927 [Guillardia theta CCMP2712]EKX46319.1 hypothetical protein GUITHDRAFT_107927 [Guillardia theta CCMP2712]|eukprot:XP_005833299.1 hypothetical protein GUITHDRAFT_107927 [Guillardia theta CCMP2712]
MEYSVNEEFVRQVSAQWGGTRSRDVNSILEIVERLWGHFFSGDVAPSDGEKIRLAAKLITRCDANSDGLLNLESFLEWYRITVDIWPLIKKTVKSKIITASNTTLTWDDNLILAKVAFDDNDEDDCGRVSQEVRLVFGGAAPVCNSLAHVQKILKVADVVLDNLSEEQNITKLERIKLCEDLLNYREDKNDDRITFPAFCSWYSSIEGKLLGIRALAAKQMVAREGMQALSQHSSPMARESSVLDSQSKQQDMLVKRKLFASRESHNETPTKPLPRPPSPAREHVASMRTPAHMEGSRNVSSPSIHVEGSRNSPSVSAHVDEGFRNISPSLSGGALSHNGLIPPESSGARSSGNHIRDQSLDYAPDLTATSLLDQQSAPLDNSSPSRVKNIAKSFSVGPIAQLDLSKLKTDESDEGASNKSPTHGADDILQRLARLNITPRKSEMSNLQPPTEVEKIRIEERIDELLQSRSRWSEGREPAMPGFQSTSSLIHTLQERKPLPSISIATEAELSAADIKYSSTSVLRSQTPRSSDASTRFDNSRPHAIVTSDTSTYTPRSSASRSHVVINPEEYSLSSSPFSAKVEDELIEFYKIYNPHKLAHIVQVAQRYRNDRRGLNQALRDRYGTDLDSLRKTRLAFPRDTPRGQESSFGSPVRVPRNTGTDQNFAERSRGGGGDTGDKIFRLFGVRLVRRHDRDHGTGYIAISEVHPSRSYTGLEADQEVIMVNNRRVRGEAVGDLVRYMGIETENSLLLEVKRGSKVVSVRLPRGSFQETRTEMNYQADFSPSRVRTSTVYLQPGTPPGRSVSPISFIQPSMELGGYFHGGGHVPEASWSPMQSPRGEFRPVSPMMGHPLSMQPPAFNQPIPMIFSSGYGNMSPRNSRW